MCDTETQPVGTGDTHITDLMRATRVRTQLSYYSSDHGAQPKEVVVVANDVGVVRLTQNMYSVSCMI